MRVSLLNSNALNLPIADNSVHCVVTSPPYYGLRDYSVSGQLGLEPTLQEYIDNTVKWCGEVWRVLREDGTFWLNLGDSYAGSGKGGNQERFKHNHSMLAKHGYKDGRKNRDKRLSVGNSNLKPKDLMLVPFRVVIALQEWGWWVRSDIVWHKPNPMPESVTDRPTKSHEYIFLLTKKKNYYYDADAIREPLLPQSIARISQANFDNQKGGPKDPRNGGEGSRNRSARQGVENLKKAHERGQGKNKRTVWPIATRPYSGAHFATFPPDIPEICIKAGTSEKGVCPVCGNQWVRVVKKEVVPTKKAVINPVVDKRDIIGTETNDQGSKRQIGGHKNGYITAVNTLGWKPTCSCCRTCDHYNMLHGEKGKCPQPYEPVPATVLDNFGGSGTTAMVANQLGRHGISLDLSPEYLQLAKKRTGITGLQEWENGKKAEPNLEGLPMFEEIPS